VHPEHIGKLPEPDVSKAVIFMAFLSECLAVRRDNIGPLGRAGAEPQQAAH